MSRSKKILSLKKRDNDENTYKFVDEIDPWVEFKQWKNKTICKSENKARSLVAEENLACSSKIRENISNSSSRVSPSISSHEQTITLDTDDKDVSDTETILPQTDRIIIQNNENKEKTIINTKITDGNFNKQNTQYREILHQNVPKLESSISSHEIDISRRKNRIWDKKDQCPYCNIDVTNFSRHLLRNHFNEASVKTILSFKKGTTHRKHLIDLLRKQGNFSVYDENIIRPVQRPTSSRSEKQLLFLPCIFCKRMYQKNSLNRHVKTCNYNNKKNCSSTRYASEGQTLIAFNETRTPFLNRLRLKSEVFSIMRADKISLTGKSDPLICQYAEDYLKKHKRPHIKNLVSNKIKELGRLLISLQENYNINSILESLNPENFDKVVSYVQLISGYTEFSKEFQAPSLALHFRTFLLSVCSTAETLILKKYPIFPIENYEISLKRIKNFSKLVSHNWKFEMGSLALKDLTEKNSLNPQRLPVTADVIIFNTYCYEVAKKAAAEVQNNITNIEAFKTLSETEKQLTKYFKRTVTIGKGSKAIPILFPTRIQKYINIMLNFRENTKCVPSENPYLFALVGSSNRWINGARTLRKYAYSCGAQYPNTITSSRLRKQVATVLQILSLDNVEMEELATFMGHTKKTHKEFYSKLQ
ncbi:uncharacterized protein LOC126748539 isoform X2 [Anthonomus grandis grandis]|uniref:uncharacterized protein LOC126748539 isoform X2 n=1 Tax=Anthonomus grandis grandis TaxID=2921223 RepID=UPI002165C08C|nr:uncharacterized protein LOC126748539 isoform X2 [Anthonomus grandis grandis]